MPPVARIWSISTHQLHNNRRETAALPDIAAFPGRVLAFSILT